MLHITEIGFILIAKGMYALIIKPRFQRGMLIKEIIDAGHYTEVERTGVISLPGAVFIIHYRTNFFGSQRTRITRPGFHKKPQLVLRAVLAGSFSEIVAAKGIQSSGKTVVEMCLA